MSSLCFHRVFTYIGGPDLDGQTRVLTLGVEGDEAVTVGPVFDRFVEDDILLQSYHGDVLKETQALQDLLHRFGFGLLRHCTNADHYLPLWWLREDNKNCLIQFK